MRSKYNSKKAEYNDRWFDSKAEAEYYKYLLELMLAGRVVNIELQPTLNLQPSFVLNGKTFRAITYTPDFLVEYDDGEKAFIDVKGFGTQQGELKYKMYKYQHERTGYMPKLIWVAQSKKYSDTGWIDYFELKKCRAESKRKGKKGND